MLTKAQIRTVRSLADKSARQAEGLFVAEGEKLVGELLCSGFTVREVYRTGENVTAAEMARLSFLRTPTPVLALAEIPRYPAAAPQGLSLALDDVQDPGNLGTLIRLADWFGVRNIYASPATADCWNPKVVQATMGAILRIRVHYGPLGPILQKARNIALPVYGTFLEGSPLYTYDLQPEGVIVMGNEGRGISPGVAAQVTDRLYIPPFPPHEAAASESLNVATAAAVILSEFRRRQQG